MGYAQTIDDLAAEMRDLRQAENALQAELEGMPDRLRAAGDRARTAHGHEHLRWQAVGAPPQDMPMMDDFYDEHVGPVRAREEEARAEYESTRLARMDKAVELYSRRAASSQKRQEPLTEALDAVDEELRKLQERRQELENVRSGLERERRESNSLAKQLERDVRTFRNQIQARGARDAARR